MSESKVREASEAAMAEPMRQAFYLVAGKVVFAHKADPDQRPNVVDVNSVVISGDGRFAVPQLAQAQGALQQGFFVRCDGEAVNVLDVTIQNLIPLGWFTKDEFNQALPAPPVAAGVETINPESIIG